VKPVTEIISARIPDDIAKDLKEIEKEERTDRATVVRKLLARAIGQWKIERALRFYREGKVTLWRAARLGGVTLREMMELAAKEGIEFQYTSKDLEEDIRAALTE
jgi:predicted HTH domain antitoxin